MHRRLIPRRLRYWLQIIRLPPRAAIFYIRALRLAKKHGDGWSLISATAPHHLLMLLRLSRGKKQVVELGTGGGWGSVVLALGHPERTVRTFDPYDHGFRDRYLSLAPKEARQRILLRNQPASEHDGMPADFLFLDSSHNYQDVIDEFNAWLPRLSPGAIVVFHD